jgi:hypothetical protein
MSKNREWSPTDQIWNKLSTKINTVTWRNFLKKKEFMGPYWYQSIASRKEKASLYSSMVTNKNRNDNIARKSPSGDNQSNKLFR